MNKIMIKTRDFIIRPIRLSDAKAYLDCHKDKEARANFSSCPSTLGSARKELQEKTTKRFAIEKDGFMVGFVTFKLNKHPRYKHSAIIGYGMHKDFRGKGIATKAVKAVTEYGFKKLGLRRISGMCRTHNKASIRVLQKAGYKHEGTLRKNKYLKGRFLDDLLWARVR